MNSTRVAGLLALVGAVVVALSLLADPLGLGSQGSGFGWKQITGVVIGAVMIVLGAFVRRRPGARADEG